jgi:hypothetical protein
VDLGWVSFHSPKPIMSPLSLEVRSGYRIQASQQDDSMRVLYYMEKELANFDPSRPGPPNGRVERGEHQTWGLGVGAQGLAPLYLPRDAYCKSWT